MEWSISSANFERGADLYSSSRWRGLVERMDGGTRKCTVHVFPVNPYGGKADIASHLGGRVRNVDAIVRFFVFLFESSNL